MFSYQQITGGEQGGFHELQAELGYWPGFAANSAAAPLPAHHLTVRPMTNLPHLCRTPYTISIWTEHERDSLPLWRGSLETASGQQWPFATLAELNRLLCELGGWMDPPEQPEKRQLRQIE